MPEPVVCDHQAHGGPGLQVGNLGRETGRDLHAVEGDFEAARAVAHGVGRVVAKVDDDLVDLKLRRP